MYTYICKYIYRESQTEKKTLLAHLHLGEIVKKSLKYYKHQYNTSIGIYTNTTTKIDAWIITIWGESQYI